MVLPVAASLAVLFIGIWMFAILRVIKGSEDALGAGIKDLARRISDVHLITPQTPGVQGTVSVRLFEAMKEVCESGRQEHLADELHETLKRSPGAMQAEVDRVYQEYFAKMRARKAAVERYIKIMLEQPKKPEA